MLIIITYHVSSNKTRTRFHKLLKNFGNPVQKSVFECRLTKEQQKLLFNKIDNFAAQLSSSDSVRIYSLCFKCLKKVKIIGNIPLTDEKLYYII
jgi:CRISPR-associated protein Cas2